MRGTERLGVSVLRYMYLKGTFDNFHSCLLSLSTPLSFYTPLYISLKDLPPLLRHLTCLPLNPHLVYQKII